MKIERVDPTGLDLAVAEEMAAVSTAELAIDAPNSVPPTAEGMLLEARHGHDDQPFEGYWLARSDDGDLVGHASLDVPHWDNPQLAYVFCSVRPEARGRGAGALLLGAQLELARDLGRSSLLTFATLDSHAASFLADHDFTVGQHTAQRRLHPRRLDYDRLARLAADAESRSADYELVPLDGPTPADLLPVVTTLFEAINDAPDDAVAREPDKFPVERIRRYDLAMRERRQHVYRLLARHRHTGEWTGHTILCVDRNRPGYAVQEDTSVVRAHRGHSLGMRLKAAMLLWMREEHPELTMIDTWNATSNMHMIAVNEALGSEVSQLGVAMQRTL
jgi:GNAT superfamily N-acetyltransferase